MSVVFQSRGFSPLLSLPAYTETRGFAPPSGSLEQILKKSRGFARVGIFVAHNVRLEFLSLAPVATSRIVPDT